MSTADRLTPLRQRLFETRLPGSTSTQIGLVAALAVVLIAVVGPYAAPHSATELVGAPFSPPSRAYPLGIDFNGRDVLSRVLSGGRSILVLATSATLFAYVVGATIGLAAGYDRRWLDAVAMRAMDVLLAFPPILFLLILATGAGPSPVVLVLAIAVIHVPGIARIIRAATLGVAVRPYVEAAVARGETRRRLLAREILPNITGTIAADIGPRFTVSILLVAAVNFLGFGLRPPAADWSIMISENRAALTIQPWTVSLSVLVPALLIAVLTVAANVVADGVARSLGRSADLQVARR